MEAKGETRKKGAAITPDSLFLGRFKPKLEALARRDGFGRTSDARTE